MTSEKLCLVIPMKKTFHSFSGPNTYLEDCLEQPTGTTGLKEPVGSQQSQKSMSHPSLRPF